MGNLIFNGKSTEDLGLVIQTAPIYTYPERDMSSVHVPGRNGDLFIDNGSFKNVDRSYSLGRAVIKGTTYMGNMAAITEWLTSAKGKYVRLEDSYDPDVYRLAMYNGSGSYSNLFMQAGTINVSFNCKPQRFLKSGEEPQSYESSSAEIVNLSHYEAKPLLTLEGIPVDELDNVLMLTVEDFDGYAVSSIAINNTPNSTMIFDSEEQTVRGTDGKELEEYSNLNGKPFPSLKEGKTKIYLKKYRHDSSLIKSYRDVINSFVTNPINGYDCKSEYLPFSRIQDQKQKKYMIKPYSSLVNSKQTIYQADSVQAHTMKNALEYKYLSPNDLFNTADRFSQSGTGDEIDKCIQNDTTFTNLISVDGYGDEFAIFTKVAGYFMCKSSGTTDKYIKWHEIGDKLCICKSTSTIDIYHYEGFIYNMPYNYEDIPGEFAFKINYANDGSPMSCDMRTDASGYYWKDKPSGLSGLFKKAGWYLLQAGENLQTLKWDTSKRAFVSTSGLTNSTTATFTFMYSKNVPAYEDIYESYTDDYGNVGRKLKSKCHFEVEEYGGDTSLEAFNLRSKDSGYYAIRLNDSESRGAYSSRVSSNTVIYRNLSGTASFDVFYCDELPTYEDVEGYPDYLSTTIKKIGGTDIEPDKVSYIAAKTGYYRWATTMDEEGNYIFTEWIHANEGDDLDVKQSGTEAAYICYTDEDPSTWHHENDRGYNGTDNKPSWLGVDLEYVDTDEQTKIRYYANTNGYYRWDTNSVWVWKNSGEQLLITGLQDDAEFFYMPDLPNYEDYDLEDIFAIVPNYEKGINEITTNYIAKVSGYYRVNANTDWTYYDIGQTILTSKQSETNTVHYLTKLSDTVPGVKITIIPRWWML